MQSEEDKGDVNTMDLTVPVFSELHAWYRIAFVMNEK